jgi:hypothetical protein
MPEPVTAGTVAEAQHHGQRDSESVAE